MDDLALLHGLLEQYSPSGSESNAVSYLVERMQSYGLKAEVDEAGNAVGVKGEGPREILLLGHIDTVPGFIEVKQDGNILYGRGAVDAKGPLACFTATAGKIQLTDGYRLTVIGAVGEEAASNGARYLVDHRQKPEIVIIGEPSGWQNITLGYKGSVWINYILHEPVSHTAANISSSCETAVEFWNDFKERATANNGSASRLFDQVSPTLRAINSRNDGFIQEINLKIGVRVPIGYEKETLSNVISELSSSAEIHIEDFTPAYKVKKNTTVVRALLAGIRS